MNLQQGCSKHQLPESFEQKNQTCVLYLDVCAFDNRATVSERKIDNGKDGANCATRTPKSCNRLKDSRRSKRDRHRKM